MNKKTFALNLLSRFAHCLYASGSIYVHTGHARVDTGNYLAKVRSSSVSTFAHNIFEGSPSKEGFHGTQ